MELKWFELCALPPSLSLSLKISDRWLVGWLVGFWSFALAHFVCVARSGMDGRRGLNLPSHFGIGSCVCVVVVCCHIIIVIDRAVVVGGGGAGARLSLLGLGSISSLSASTSEAYYQSRFLDILHPL